MQFKFLAFIYFIIFITGCSTQTLTSSPKGELAETIEDQTFHAEYPGPSLSIGDRVGIFRYESLTNDLKRHQSRVLPQKMKKIFIGKGSVSTVLKNNFYEFKSEGTRFIPKGAFIEKL